VSKIVNALYLFKWNRAPAALLDQHLPKIKVSTLAEPERATKGDNFVLYQTKVEPTLEIWHSELSPAATKPKFRLYYSSSMGQEPIGGRCAT
jgi:hypothetical protein